MKKFFALMMAMTLVVGLASCSGKDNDTKSGTDSKTESTTSVSDSADGYEIALVTDVGTIDDKSFNQGAWEGVKAYADANSKTYKYYQPDSADKASLLAQIDLAVEGGAKIVVCPGFNFETAIFEAQTTYTDVHFILLDGEPHTEDYATYETKENVMPILYAEQQSGFLAGYAVVKDGYTKLGFMGGMAVPAVIRYGYGFVQGADAAAKELGVDVDIKYTYTGKFEATPEAKATAAGWYSDGTEVIFGCGGALGNSVMAAAESAGKKAIGVDVDQSSESTSVITSAMKNLSKSVELALESFYNDTWVGGQTTTLDVTKEGVELPMATSTFEKFTQEDYDAIYAKLVSGEVAVQNDTVAETADKIPGLEKTTVTVIE